VTSVVAPQRVLSTLNLDGSRRWLRPKWSRGRYATMRRIVAYVLMLVFLLVPHLRRHGKPLFLLDLPRREFTLFGTTFLPTDTLLLMLLMVSIAIAIFLLTALFGRVWCGWACPQTVYMEFLFRPIERLFEGGRSGSLALDKTGGLHWRRVMKWGVYLVLSLVLAHTFLAYFVGVDQLAIWVRRAPTEHWTSFIIMAGTTAAIFLDFAWFREQTCVVACPYGRLQSVLLDRQSLIVGYDTRRGEPRGKLGSGGVRNRLPVMGDCIDCGACVITCPTGIDIRDGLQMECIHCTQCADACDSIMDKIGKPRGLIRYATRDAFDGKRLTMLRPRVVLYPAALVLFGGLFAWNLGTRAGADVTVLRGRGEPYTEQPGHQVANQLRIKIVNRSSGPRSYLLELAGGGAVRLIAPGNPVALDAGRTAESVIFLVAPREAFEHGELTVTLRVSDGTGFVTTIPYRLVGPEPDEHEREHEEGHR
jgi:cytochrome c oxidase accessory protein FixG